MSLSPEELAALDIAIETMKRSGLAVEADDLLNLREKVVALVPRSKAARLETDHEALLEAQGLAARPGPRQRVDRKTAAAIAEAIKACRILEFLHRGDSRDAPELVTARKAVFAELPRLLFRPRVRRLRTTGEAPVGGPGPLGTGNDPRGNLGPLEPASTWLTNCEPERGYPVPRLQEGRARRRGWVSGAFVQHDDDTDPDIADGGRPRLGRRQRIPEDLQEPPVDPALLDWAKREKTIIAEHVAARRVVREGWQCSDGRTSEVPSISAGLQSVLALPLRARSRHQRRARFNTSNSGTPSSVPCEKTATTGLSGSSGKQ